MHDLDIQQNGKLTFNYPDKLKRIVDDIYEKEVELATRQKMLNVQLERQAPFTIKSEYTTTIDGQPLEWEANAVGWGSQQKVVFDKKTGEQYI